MQVQEVQLTEREMLPKDETAAARDIVKNAEEQPKGTAQVK